jgi:cytochrome P450
MGSDSNVFRVERQGSSSQGEARDNKARRNAYAALRPMAGPLVSPPPPELRGPPFIGSGLDFLRDPTAFLKRERARVGDVFQAKIFGFDLLFVFSPAGLRSLYQLPEDVASFTEATRALIGLKLPKELLAGDMTMFHHLFGRDRMEGYVAHIHDAVLDEIGRLGDQGELEVFRHMKGVVHKLGFRCWAGREAASPRYLDRLVALFERLDPEQAFVHPAQMLLTVVTRKAPERRALRAVEAILTSIRDERRRRGAREGDMLDQLEDLYADRPEAERDARVAADVILLHLASQTNLYASMAWVLINLLGHEEHRARFEAECRALADKHGPSWLRDPQALAKLTHFEQCAHESIRLAQRSLTLRRVVKPCTLETGGTTYALRPGVFVATLLSVMNSAFDGLEVFDPAHYERGRVVERVGLPTKESVSTFGHGRHACVGERFAMNAMKITLGAYLTRFELTPRFTTAAPPPGQMGAVSRAAAPCMVAYRKRPEVVGS